ncbi:MAG: hypothetical protein Q7R76_00195 [Candidatus Woesearchaeota archaeon]|nr:hypothetical protein [Candidatus Woesearchaeota archaeon]
MAQIEIVESLFEEIEKTFKQDADRVFDLIEELEENPHKGKLLGTVGGIVIKELKYNTFRFYFIVDGFKLRCIQQEELTDILLKFVRMSDKKHQQQTIGEIKHILRTIGVGGFV